MPIIPDLLGILITTKVSSKMKSISNVSPLQQKNPSYFMEMCTGIGKGIAMGTPVISFMTTDSGLSGIPPAPAPGSGVGIIVDAQHMSEQMYTLARNSVISEFKETASDPWPPKKGNSGEFLKAITDGVSEAIQEHFQTAWTLSSVHNMIYMGTGEIKPGGFFGLSADLVAQSIVQSSPSLKGGFWPKAAESIAKGYVKSIQEKATGVVSITGVCVPPAQVCGIPLSDISGPTAGTGAAA
jgi:hypothetical protein